MINTKTLRSQFKAVRASQKTSASIGQWVIITLLLIVGAGTLYLAVRGICLGIVVVHQLIK